MKLTKEQAILRLLDDPRSIWTPSGARALVEHLLKREAETGEEVVFDLVGLSGEFSEYKDLAELAYEHDLDAKYLGLTDKELDDTEKLNAAVMKYVEDHNGELIYHDEGLILREW